MEEYNRLSINNFEVKREIMANKEEYAKLFSEGRKSLEKLLLTCYEHDIMSISCCSGHMLDRGSFEHSYLYLKLRKSDLDVFSNIIQICQETDLKEICDLEENIQASSPLKNYFGFTVRSEYNNADMFTLN